MSEQTFYSMEELKEYLQTVPEGKFVKVTVEVGNDGEETGEESE